MAEPKDMYQCQVANCGYIYNPDKGCKKRGVAKGTCWQDLSEDFCCPNCGAGRKMFKPLAGPDPAAGQGN
jgi:rubredoxin